MRTLVRVAISVLLAFIVAGCKKEHGIGDDSLLDFKDKDQARLGAASPTPSPAEQAAPAPQTKQGVGQSPAQPEAPPIEQPQFQIAIQSDNAGSQFDPVAARVTKGTKVSWINRDHAPRSVEADDGSFKSGPIAPGAAWVYVAGRPGKFGYHDGTRPYAVASIEVV